MNRTLQLFLLLVSPLVMQAQTYISEPGDSTAFIEYNDGKQWVYKSVEGLTSGMANEIFQDQYGKYYQIGFFFNNERDTTVTFVPEEVFSELLTNKGDTISMLVYTEEAFKKKTKKNRIFASILMCFAGGVSVASGYPTSFNLAFTSDGSVYPSVTTNGTYPADLAANMQFHTLSTMIQQKKAIREEGYLKQCAIAPGESIFGFMNIRHKKGRQLLVGVKVGGSEFSYLWDVEKKKKSKKKKEEAE